MNCNKKSIKQAHCKKFKKRRNLLKVTIGILVPVIVIVFVMIYAAFIEPKLLTVKNHFFSSDKIQGDAITIVQFTDTHLGDYFTVEQLQGVVDKINEQGADVVVFTGDLFDAVWKYKGETRKVKDVLSKIKAKHGKFAVFGNRDIGGGAKNIYKEIIENAGFTLLVNSNSQLTINETAINIMGTDDALIGDYDYTKTVNDIDEKKLNILLIHEPDLIKYFEEFPIDLALSGHSHGGQVYLPIFGSLIKTAKAKLYVRGLYQLDAKLNTMLYVNTGLGNTRMPFRLFNVPNIAVFKMNPAIK